MSLKSVSGGYVPRGIILKILFLRFSVKICCGVADIKPKTAQGTSVVSCESWQAVVDTNLRTEKYLAVSVVIFL